MNASASSIAIDARPEVQYLLRLGDTCLILGQRLGEWCGHAPMLEEDIAMANMALDLIGQARALLTRAGQLEGRAHDEDQLAFLRDERDYFNATLAELPRGDFAFTVLRNADGRHLAASLMWERLVHSSDAELAAIAGQGAQGSALPPAARGRLGGAPGRRHARNRARACQAALAQLWRYVPELFTDDATEAAARASGLGPAWSELQANPGRPKWPPCCSRGHAGHAGRIGLPQHGPQAACTASTWASSWPRCSTCSAPIPGGVW